MTRSRREAPPVVPSVAVIVRTKNRPDFLRVALQGILAQRFTDYRIVVVNDGGDPAEVEQILQQVGLKISEVSLLHHERSLGRAGAANAGIAASQSPYIVLHDDDDAWEPEFLERAVAYLHTFGTGGVVTRCGVAHDVWDGSQYVTERTELLHATTSRITLAEQLRHNLCPPIAFLYSRHLHEKFGWYDSALPQLEDWDFSLRVLAGGATIGFVEGEPLAWWHLRLNSAGEFQNISLSDDAARRQSITMMIDRHLRDELDGKGRLGSPFLVAQQYDDQRQRIDALENHLGLVGQHLSTILERQQQLLISMAPPGSRPHDATTSDAEPLDADQHGDELLGG